ncbi:MAG: universal stress protein [Thermoplasmatota archaeon]
MKEFRRILVPVDEGKVSEKAFRSAMDLASMIDGRITLLHVIEVEEPVLGGIETELDEELKNRGMKIISRFSKEAKGSDLELDPVLVEGDAASVINEGSRDHDLIIMGTHGRSTLASMVMGSVADSVMRNSCCPVLLLR